jgi:hypothetical protein
MTGPRYPSPARSLPNHFRGLPNRSTLHLLPSAVSSKPFLMTPKPFAITSKQFPSAPELLKSKKSNRKLTTLCLKSAAGVTPEDTFTVCGPHRSLMRERSGFVLQPGVLEQPASHSAPFSRFDNVLPRYPHRRERLVSLALHLLEVEPTARLQRVARSSPYLRSLTKSGSPTQSHSHKTGASYELQHSSQTRHGGSRP